jgi:hypothetical protein
LVDFCCIELIDLVRSDGGSFRFAKKQFSGLAAKSGFLIFYTFFFRRISSGNK